MQLDRQTIRAHFSRAASSYDAAAVLQHEVESRLQERLDGIKRPPDLVLDIGAGPGRGALGLQAKLPQANVVALDLSLAMLREAKRRQSWLQRWRRPLNLLCADAQALPLSAGSVDLMYSNLCIQWCQQLDLLLQEWRRVLKPGGMVLLSSFGPGTLMQLRQAWASVDDKPRVNQFVDMHVLGDLLLAQGFRDPVLETDRFILRYPSVGHLLRELKAIGASNAHQARSKGLGGRSLLAQMQAAYPKAHDGTIEAQFEIVYAQAFAPPDGAPIRSATQDVASVPIASIPIRRKAN